MASKWAIVSLVVVLPIEPVIPMAVLPQIFRTHRSNRAPAQCLLNEVVPVEAFAFDSKKEFAGLHRAGVDGISLSHRVTVVLARCSDEFGDAGEKKFHAVFPAVPAFATVLQS